MKKIGIYKITNMVNGKVYIGKSNNVVGRMERHKIYLRRNKHYNSHIQNSWDCYGEQSFGFSILKECSLEELQYWEEYYINLYESYKRERGYNFERYFRGTIIVSEETKRKISESMMGERHWNCKGENGSFYGKHHSEEAKQKISRSKMGEKHPRAKLTWEKVEEIREKYIPWEYTMDMLAKEYDVGKSTITHVINNTSWKEN